MFIIENNRKLFRCVQYFIIVALCLQFGVSSGLTQPTVSHTTNETTTATTSRTKSYREKLEDAKLPYIDMVLGGTGVVCNTLLILAIVIDPLKILHRGAWITIVNLSFADFLACGSNFLGWFVFQKQDREIQKAAEKPTRFFWLFGVSASFMLLTLLTIQIYIIIKYPMKSRLLLTKKKVLFSCGIIWVIAILCGLLDVDIWFEGEKDVLYFFIGYVAVLELVVLFQIVLKILIIVEILSSRDGHLLNSDSQSNQKQREVAKTVLMLNVILFVTAFPWFVFKQIEILSRLGHLGEQELPEMLYSYYEPVALLNFVANPLLYSLRLPDYRRSLLALFKCKCKVRSRSKRSSSSSQSMMTRNKTPLMGTTETTGLESTKL